MRRLSRSFAAVLLIMVTSACIVVPIRTTTATRDPSGTKRKIPGLAITPGKTTRAEVEEQYAGFSVDSGTPNLFWARFSQSKWAMLAGFGGYGGGSASTFRVWGSRNQLIRFDGNGVVESAEVVPDGALLKYLAALPRENGCPALDLSRPITLTGTELIRNIVDLQLSANNLVVTRFRPSRVAPRKPPQVANIPFAQLADIKIENGDDPYQPAVHLEFSQKTQVGKRVVLYLSPKNVLTVVRWQQQLTSNTVEKAKLLPKR